MTIKMQQENVKETKPDSLAESESSFSDDYQSILSKLNHSVAEQTWEKELRVRQEVQLLEDPLKHPLYEKIEGLLSEDKHVSGEQPSAPAITKEA